MKPPKRKPAARRPLDAALPYDTISRAGLAAFAVVLGWIVLFVHRTPAYGVETDLFGEAIPAARALLERHVDAGSFQYKGPGYPALLVVFSALSRGDLWLAARIVNLLAAVLGAWSAWRLSRAVLGPARACFVTLALCANPVFVQATFEAGTDAPAFALAIGATALLLDDPGVAQAALAGILVGAATLTRYNAAFLIPAGLLALLAWPARPGRRARTTLAFAAACALLVAPWLAWNRQLHGAALANENYLNLAYELYGKGMSWDQFWNKVAPSFHSLGEVLRYDPWGAALHFGRNLALHWTLDLRSLVPAWLGGAALLGAFLHVGAARRHAAWLAFYLLCYVTLALIFYNVRFFLYLLPFYLGAAALLVFPRPAWARRAPPVRLALAAIAVALLGVASQRAVAALLVKEPREMPLAASFLRARARPGDRVIARKPQVAYFAGMEYEPMPEVASVRGLIAAARQRHADYVYLSGIEYQLRPQLRILMTNELDLPGLTPLSTQLLDDQHYETVYRVEPPSPADAAFDDSLVAGLDRLAPRYAGNADQLDYIAAQYYEEGRWDKALACLDQVIALDPSATGEILKRAATYARLGRLDESAADCQHVLLSEAHPAASAFVLLGCVRAIQGKLGDARKMCELAAHAEPASPGVLLALATARLAAGDSAAGEEACARVLRLDPRLAPVCVAAKERGARGETAYLVRLLSATEALLTRPDDPLPSLADSVRRGAFEVPAPPATGR